MNLSLPALKFDLPEWHDSQFAKIKRSEGRLKQLVQNAGTNSDQFKLALAHIFRAVCKDRKAPASVIKKGVDVRAFTYLLATSSDFFNHIELTTSLFEHLRSVRSPMSKIALTQLIRAFLTNFDLYTDGDGLKRWAQFIQEELAQYVGKKGDSQLFVFVENRDLIFSSYGPSRIVREAQEEQMDFDNVLTKFCLTGFSDARYIQLCRYQYYLQTLKSLAVGEDHPILAEIVKPDVVNSPYMANKQLGHEILEILIDRSGADAISPGWQRAVLEIAGDPRVSKSSARYQQWWSLLGDARVTKVRGWLSRFDLKLFLEVLEQSARDSGNKDMERMFGDRKVFMEGLLSQGFVTGSRLFLSRSAEMYLKRSYRKQELPEYAKLNSTQTSVIYLNLSGRAHMIEGSHSFKIKFMDKLPKALDIENYSISVFEDQHLRMKPNDFYDREFGYSGFSETEGFVEFAHHTQLSWQHKAIEYLKSQNIKVEIAKLIPRDKYRLYKQKFGVS